MTAETKIDHDVVSRLRSLLKRRFFVERQVAENPDLLNRGRKYEIDALDWILQMLVDEYPAEFDEAQKIEDRIHQERQSRNEAQP